jgi:hypothetical protein
MSGGTPAVHRRFPWVAGPHATLSSRRVEGHARPHERAHGREALRPAGGPDLDRPGGRAGGHGGGGLRGGPGERGADHRLRRGREVRGEQPPGGPADLDGGGGLGLALRPGGGPLGGDEGGARTSTSSWRPSSRSAWGSPSASRAEPRRLKIDARAPNFNGGPPRGGRRASWPELRASWWSVRACPFGESSWSTARSRPAGRATPERWPPSSGAPGWTPASSRPTSTTARWCG